MSALYGTFQKKVEKGYNGVTRYLKEDCRLSCDPPFSSGTVPSFNSCTKFMGIKGIIHDRTPDCQQVSMA